MKRIQQKALAVARSIGPDARATWCESCSAEPIVLGCAGSIRGCARGRAKGRRREQRHFVTTGHEPVTQQIGDASIPPSPIGGTESTAVRAPRSASTADSALAAARNRQRLTADTHREARVGCGLAPPVEPVGLAAVTPRCSARGVKPSRYSSPRAARRRTTSPGSLRPPCTGGSARPSTRGFSV